MKKLLYITANSKPEHLSTSKTVGREFVNRFLEKNPDYGVEELNLYSEHIPEVNHRIFTHRGEPASGEQYNNLSREDKKEVDRINQLCDQFLKADVYVVAAPMWSISFPSILKRYVDCVVIKDRTIKISQEEVVGLLGDKTRNMVYIQSSGGVYPKLLNWKINHGVDYFHDLFKFLGVDKFEKVLVQGTGDEDVGIENAKVKAFSEVDDVIEKFSREPMFI
jgi:FMN-dependent NADH-azoreductase